MPFHRPALVLLLTAIVGPGPMAAMLSDDYEVAFELDGRRITEARGRSVVDVLVRTLDAQGTMTIQEKEIRNFAHDLSDLELSGAAYVSASLTNRLDAPRDAPVTDTGFVKAFDYRNGRRVSLSSEIRFQLALGSNATNATVTCKGNTFRVYQPGAGHWVGIRQKDFSLRVRNDRTTCAEVRSSFRATCCGLSEADMDVTVPQIL